MTYEELKAKAKWFDAPRNWGDTDEEILANIKMNIQLEASKQYINLLTNVDMNVRTTTHLNFWISFTHPQIWLQLTWLNAIVLRTG